MKKLFITIVLIFTPLISKADGSTVMQKVSASMVAVVADLGQGKTSSGSGEILMEDEVLTNCHVVKNAEKIIVQFSDGENAPATIKGRVGNLDLCALSVITNKRPKVKIAPLKDIKIGQPIFAIGNPLSLKFTISDGVVSAIREQEKSNVIQISAPISHGSSGGGVFDEKARLIGITTFTLVDGQNLNFAIPAEYRNTIGIQSLEKGDSNTEPQKSVTFKGIPFGISLNQFKSSFPSIKCTENFLGTMCNGGSFEYLGRIAKRFTAWFKNNKFYNISVYFEAVDAVDVETELKNRINGYFGNPEKKATENQINTNWSPNKNQVIMLTPCGFFDSCWPGDAAWVEITDGSVFKETNSDF